MGLFSRKNKEAIPPVVQQSAPPPSYRTAPSDQGSVRSGFGPGPANGMSPVANPSALNGGLGDRRYVNNGGAVNSGAVGSGAVGGKVGAGQYGYSRPVVNNAAGGSAGADPDAARNELLSGARERRFVPEPTMTGNEEEDVEALKQATRQIKQDSVQSTRNALQSIQQAEDVGRSTLEMLGRQSDSLANTERHLDVAKTYNSSAQKTTKEIERLNRSIFIPNVSFGKRKAAAEEEARITTQYRAEQEERDKIRQEQQASRALVDRTFREADRELASRSAPSASGAPAARPAARSRYQFEADAEDDAMEQELDRNLDDLLGGVGRLKALAIASGTEVNGQLGRIGRINAKADTLDVGVVKSTRGMDRIK